MDVDIARTTCRGSRPGLGGIAAQARKLLVQLSRSHLPDDYQVNRRLCQSTGYACGQRTSYLCYEPSLQVAHHVLDK
jgi:hypothetical protein